MEKPKTIVCDLDGTLCDSSWRSHFVSGEKKNWKAFLYGVSADPVKYDILALLLDEWVNADCCHVVFLTGRSMDHYTDTFAWLKRNMPAQLMGKSSLMMRKIGDNRVDVLMKLDEVVKIQEQFDIILAIDDKPSIASMFEDLGVKILLV